MATVVQRAEANSSSNTTSYTLPGAAFTPVEGDQLVIGLVCSATTDDVPTLVETAGGGTYSLVHSQPWSGTSARLYVFVRDTLVGASPAARQLTLTLTDAATGCAMEAMAVTGLTLEGLAAVVQGDGFKDAAATTPNFTFGAAVDTANVTVLFACNGASPPALDPPVGWTELDEVGYTAPTIGLEVSHRDSGFTGTTVTWNAASASAWGAAGVELDVSGASGLDLDLGDIPSTEVVQGVDLTASGPVALLLGDIPSTEIVNGIDLTVAGPLALLLGDIPSTEVVSGIDLTFPSLSLELGAVPSAEVVNGVDLTAAGPMSLLLGTVPGSSAAHGIDLASSALTLLLGNVPATDATHGITLSQSGPVTLSLGAIESALDVLGVDLSQSGPVSLLLGRVAGLALAQGITLELGEAGSTILVLQAEFEAGIGQVEYEGGVRVSEYAGGMEVVEF